MRKILLQSLLIGILVISPVFASENINAENNLSEQKPVQQTTVQADKNQNSINSNYINLNEMFSGENNEKSSNDNNSSEDAVNKTDSNQEIEKNNISNFSGTNAEGDNSTQLKGYLEYDPSQDSNETSVDGSTNDNDSMPFYIEQAAQMESGNNSVVLDDSTFKSQNINIKSPPKFSTKSLITNDDKIDLSKKNNTINLEAASRFSDVEYWISPIYTSYSQTSGKFSVGTSYYSGLDSASLSSSTGIFTRYDGKHFAISTSFYKSAQYNDEALSNNFSIAPELKLTKRLSLLDELNTDTEQINRSNKIVIRYKPKIKNHEDDVQLEFGAGQSFYENQYVDSSVSFSTRFKL